MNVENDGDRRWVDTLYATMLLQPALGFIAQEVCGLCSVGTPVLGLLRVLRRLPALRDLSMHHLRLQVNKGNGGCYTMHTDSGVSGVDSAKRHTFLFFS